ncbi:hypothetical protein V6N13_144023 [Hibiscus sabdariffa]
MLQFTPMAKSHLILAGALLLVFLLTHGVTSSEGIRVLKAEILDEPGNHVTKMMSRHQRNILEDAYRTNDVHPTPHGHSPGAGHSTGPCQ